jgi:nitrite reductase (NO-forming)
MRENLVPIVVASVLVGGLLYWSTPAEKVSPSHADRPTASTAGPPPQQQRPPANAPNEQQAARPSPAETQARSSAAPASAPTEHNHGAAPAPASAPTGHNHGAAPAPAQRDASAPAQRDASQQQRASAAGAPAPQVVAQAPARPPQQPTPRAAAPGGDPQAGRLVYRKCQACHSLEPGKNTLGPSLAGIFGKKAGEVPNFNYSPALKASNIVWDVAALDAYLLDPQKAVPGNKMPFPGLKTENERRDVIAYLASTMAGAQTAQAPRAPGTPPPAATPAQPAPRADQRSVSYIPDVRYTLRSGIAEGRMVFLGVGGAIDGQVNPLLSAAEGQVVQVTLINGEGAEHDIVFPEQDAKSPRITGRGSSTIVVFRATRVGDFRYICSVPGHELAGMRGQFVVTPRPPAQVVVEADISQKSTDVPPPLENRPPQTIRVDLIAVELEGRLAEGTTFGYWTFNGRVPGPMLRVRVGDTLDVHVKNSADSSMIHSVDFHAATGPGGGAAATQVDPGHEKSFKFKALVPGLYVYHCATPMVAHHIANGMYGLILVEPEGGLPPVDREFYVMQGEIYTEAPFGQRGSQEFSVEKLLNERPEYFVFNGSVGALSKLHPLEAKVGETVRIYFGVGGPNYTSSFHVIGEIFDRVYNLGDVLSPPGKGIQTVTVPAGGATIVEFKLDVPGNYILVDHALSRAERGLVGIMKVEGPNNPEIFEGKIDPDVAH